MARPKKYFSAELAENAERLLRKFHKGKLSIRDCWFLSCKMISYYLYCPHNKLEMEDNVKAIPKIQGSLLNGFMREIPENKFLANINKIIDFEKCRSMLDKCYENIGRCAYDPVILLKMLLLQRWYNLSDRAVVAEAADTPIRRPIVISSANSPIGTRVRAMPARLFLRDIFLNNHTIFLKSCIRFLLWFCFPSVFIFYIY